MQEGTLPQTLLQSVASWPFDFAQLLVHPRRGLTAQLVTQPNLMTRSVVFVLSHIVAGWLFVQQDLVASVPAFVLTGVPEGAFILMLVMVPFHLAARLLRAPEPRAPTTMMMLAYVQSVAMVLVAGGSALIWTGLTLANPDIGPSMRSVVYTNLPIEVRIARFTEVIQPVVGLGHSWRPLRCSPA